MRRQTAIATASIAALLVGAALAGCAKSPPIPPPGQPRQAGPSLGPEFQGAEAAPPLEAVPHPTRPTMTDGTLLAYVEAANSAEVEQGGLARTQAAHPSIQAYAERMAKEHAELREDGHRLAAALHLGAAPSLKIESLLADHADTMDELRRKAGGGFDAAYLEQNIRAHQRIVERLDEAARDDRHPEVKRLLDRVRPMLKDHLRRAQQLQRAMLSGQLDYTTP